MRHDIFEFDATEMTWADKAWRIVLLSIVIGILIADLVYFRPN